MVHVLDYSSNPKDRIEYDITIQIPAKNMASVSVYMLCAKTIKLGILRAA